MAISLQLASDTGPSSADRVTRGASLNGTGAAANAQVDIFNDGTLLGTVTADEAGAFSFARQNLVDGLYFLSATDGTGAPANLNFRLDTTAPAIPLVRFSNAGNVDLPVDPGTGATIINAAVRNDRFDINVVTSGVEGGIGLTANFGLVGTEVTIPRPVNVFANNPVGDGIATISVRSTNAFGTAFQSVPDGLYTIAVNAVDQAGNPAVQATRSVLIDTTADAGGDACLAVDGTADGAINATEARSVAFTVTGVDADVLTSTARFIGSGGTRDVALTGGNGTYSVDLSGFDGSVTSTLLVTDSRANTATIAGMGVQIDPTADAAAPAVTKIDNADGSPLVDDLFYLSRNSDVAAAGVDADTHYAEFGFREGRDPNAFFSTTGYLAANPDVRAMGVNPLTHYDQFGFREGRDPGANFDNEFYYAANPDVRTAGVDPLTHYLAFGQAEGRKAYAAVGNATDLEKHEGFDAEYYLLANADVAKAALAAGGDTFNFAHQHFDAHGWKEGRDPNAIFDTKGYLDAYKDVAAAGINPLDHFHDSGWKEGRDAAADFDTKAYLAANADVKSVGVDPMLHYLQNGALEGRSAFNDGHFG
ncbi:UNVERIFIED_ORG: hypothetical protein J2W75_002325 [Methylorubrum zatmanii]|uniref:Ig-like domain-containing protein n=1 Tax=Methylorubrum extorquens TaxID=408 RepID=UPI00209F6992|nr:Ig-like domain-containing protein [Methylorubrum extorquens]MCP1558858.1 hypothetical protein [Methylorubrum extorquens]